jgi:alpha-tubulin suppressor-like RCC1 family protein
MTLTDIAAIAAGSDHCLAVSADGTLWAWGSNSSGQLGDGTSMGSSTPVVVSNLSGVTSVAAGSAHSLALRSGSVWAWGSNGFGQLGNGTSLDSHVPVQVVVP